VKNLLLKAIKPVSLSVTLVLSSLAAPYLSAADFTTPRSVFADNQGSIIPQLNFTQSATGDIYLAYRINGDGAYYFITKDTGIVTEPLAYDSITSYSGVFPLPEFDTLNLPSGRYQLYQVLAISGANVLDINNWVGGIGGLNSLNFTIGAASADGDLNNDGWFDDDLNHDGFHDDDLDRNGFHDDDLNKDGYHDVAASVTRGKVTYDKECASCHGTNPKNNRDGILSASNAAATSSAISRNKGGMGYLSYLSSTDLQDIADYINSL
jgi:cytochrome c553